MMNNKKNISKISFGNLFYISRVNQIITVIISILFIIMLYQPPITIAAQSKSPWPSFRHDLRNSGLSEYNARNNPGKLSWAYEIDKGWYSPVIGLDNTIYVGIDGNYLFAISQKGELKWKFKTNETIIMAPTIGGDGSIYMGTENGNLYAIHPDGTFKWKYHNSTHPIEASPKVTNDNIFFGSKGLTSLSLDGKLNWIFNAGETVCSIPAINDENNVYFTTCDNEDHRFKDYLFSLNFNGSLIWKFEVGLIRTSPAIGMDGTVYISDDNNHFYAINPNGTMKWEFDKGDHGPISSPAIDQNNTIYFVSSSLYAMNPNGTLKWKKIYVDDFGAFSPILSADGLIFINGISGLDMCLYAIKTNGIIKWKYCPGGRVVGDSPAIGSDGTIFFPTQDHLIAVGKSASYSINLFFPIYLFSTILLITIFILIIFFKKRKRKKK